MGVHADLSTLVGFPFVTPAWESGVGSKNSAALVAAFFVGSKYSAHGAGECSPGAQRWWRSFDAKGAPQDDKFYFMGEAVKEKHEEKSAGWDEVP